MARYINNRSNNYNVQLARFQGQESTVLASCYSAEPSTPGVNGFHYCATLGAGMLRRSPLRISTHAIQEHSGIPEVPSGFKPSIPSPPLEQQSWPRNNWPGPKGEAAHTIPEECERLFCDKLFTTFLGEGTGARQEPLGMGTSENIQRNRIGPGHDRIQRWIEVWDYTGDAIYRGFVADTNGDRSLFVFFEDSAVGHGLKSGLIALFELAGIDAFRCSQIVACVRRSQHMNEMELVRNLGWCGFNLTTLETWSTGDNLGPLLSTKWLFLVAEV